MIKFYFPRFWGQPIVFYGFSFNILRPLIVYGMAQQCLWCGHLLTMLGLGNVGLYDMAIYCLVIGNVGRLVCIMRPFIVQGLAMLVD